MSSFNLEQPSMKKKNPALRLVMTSLGCASVVGALIPKPALPQASYYEGKTIKAIVGQAPGGLGANRVKAIVPFLQKYIPGKPHIVTEYMEGAGGQKARTTCTKQLVRTE
jgi:tripartite-type tricarboxylate transporter receptor subunit TctC